MDKMPSEEDLPKVSQLGTDYKKYIFIGLFVLLLIIINLKSCLKEDEKKAPEKIEQNMPDYHDVKKADLALVTKTKKKQEHNNLAKNSELLKVKLAYLAQQQKMYRMRQNASIDLLKSDNTLLSGLDSLPVKTLNNHASSLPLSQKQIDALRQANFGNTSQDSSDLNFQAQTKNTLVETAEAIKIPHQSETIAQGTLISGVLQTAINSDLPGMLKANVSEDVYSINGKNKLIPKGSILIGTYNSGILMGQKRVLVMWTRLIRPDGIYVMLGSPGTDSLGRSGLGADVLDTHFWERFGEASLLSIIGTGIATAGVDNNTEYNSASEYRMALSSNFNQSANAVLNQTVNRKPTIHVYQGTKINVFVNRDLSFYALNQGEKNE